MSLEFSLTFQLVIILLLGMFCQWLGWRLKLPAILFLLLTGILLGPVSGLWNPDEIFGELLFPFVSLGVAIILFEGSLTLRFSEIRGVGRVIRNLTSIGMLITWWVMALAAYWLVDLSVGMSLLFGALVSVTGPTVIVPMIRSLRTTERIGNILRWEGIIVDPIGALLAVLVYEWILTGHRSESIQAFIAIVVVGVVAGIVGALFLYQVLKRHWLPEYLTNYFSLALVLLVFTLSNELAHESGLVAVTVMGMALANMKGISLASILDFKEHLTVLLISLLFIVLAARMNLDSVLQLGWMALALLAVAQFVVRPLAVWLSSMGSELSWQEKSLLSWIAPRGIVAAAISALFALKLSDAGVANADILVSLTFVLIIGTVVFQSATARFLAKALGLSMAGQQGVLIQGANRVSIAIADALTKQGFSVLLVDDNRLSVSDARMAGLRTWYGNLLSERADLYLDLSGLTHLLLMSRNADRNALIYTQYRPDFEANRIYALSPTTDTTSEQKQMVAELTARALFGDDVSWNKLASLLAQGAEIRVTKLTEGFTYQNYLEHWKNKVIPLFAISPDHHLCIYSSDNKFQPETDWMIGGLVIGNEAGQSNE